MAAERVIVVGAGVAGLSAAAVLAARGCAVTVVERRDLPGGKLRETRAGDGPPIDVGPTVLTLRPMLEELFAAAGARLDDHLRLHRAEVLARHFWTGGATLDLFADAARSEAAMRDFAGAGEAAAFRAFQADARHAFATLYAPFMRRPAPSFLGLLLRAGPAALSRVDPYASLWAHLGRRFADPRLRQLFGRYATYVGASPMAAPATLMLIADVEAQGVWLVEGGMARLAQALGAVALEHGATVRCGAAVAGVEIDRGRARGVRLGDGERLEADAVVSAVDLAALQSGALGGRAAAGLGRAPRSGRR
ncbi:MAG: FAD-dependent oxidoreductase, partial [Caulobacteraceae bacterium]|nr:FAD-dependent oxidoreductase [Caulobacter sp.]